jgi:RND superfamily putative drug exporter
VAAHPRGILAAWVVIIALGAWGAHRLPQVAIGGTGGIEGSPSRVAGDTLRQDFDDAFIDPLVVAVAAPRLDVDQEPYRAWVAHTAEVVGALPEIKRVSAYSGTHDPHMRSADGHVTLLLAAPAASDNVAQQRAVVAVRGALKPLRAQLLRLDAHSQIAVTGSAAGDYDVNAWSATGGDRAEKQALPLTLAILAVAFGTLVAACLPFVMGLATTTVALGAAFVLASLVSVSNLLSNVVTMVGLAIGIDYSLLMVTHYREHVAGSEVAGGARERIVGAVAATVAQGGKTIAFSGLTVMIGFLGLLFSPILETRCAGIGGALVVCISVLAALTLLPAALELLGPYMERWPVLPRRWRLGATGAAWHRLGEFILRHRFGTVLLAGGFVIALGLPVLKGSSGVTNERWFLPRAVESRIGAEMLDTVRSDNASLAIHAIVRANDGAPLLAAAHHAALEAYVARLRRDARIGSVESPLTLPAGAPAAAGDIFLSRDRRAALFDITPADGLPLKKIEQLARDLVTVVPDGPFSVQIGGAPADHNDFDDAMFHSLPRIFGFVIGATLVLLFLAFRSYLLPVKAVVMNLLAVAAGIGAVVAVFQLGWLHGLIGLERPFAAIPLEVPIMVFCLSFGLSMDYELFLLFSIQRHYLRDGDNDRATVDGLVAVAPVITGAGLIMAVVFGAFAAAQLPVLKMMGVGLCVSVLVDSTVIRALLVPAVMAIAGRWNWYPGR